MSAPDPTAAASSSTSAHSSVRVFLPPSSSTSSSTPTLLPPPPSDEDLKPTAEELKTAFRSTLLGRHGPDAPLMTRALREREELRLGLNTSRARHWDNVKIRLRFADRTMVESTFSETDTIDRVYDFLDEVVSEEVRRVERVLYTAPPRVEYRVADKKVKGKTLRELGLIPSAVVNVKWAEERMNSNAFPAPIKQELKQRAEALPLPPQQTEAGSQPSKDAREGKDAKEAKPMPKWLKNIVKK